MLSFLLTLFCEPLFNWIYIQRVMNLRKFGIKIMQTVWRLDFRPLEWDHIRKNEKLCELILWVSSEVFSELKEKKCRSIYKTSKQNGSCNFRRVRKILKVFLGNQKPRATFLWTSQPYEIHLCMKNLGTNWSASFHLKRPRLCLIIYSNLSEV